MKDMTIDSTDKDIAKVEKPRRKVERSNRYSERNNRRFRISYAQTADSKPTQTVEHVQLMVRNAIIVLNTTTLRPCADPTRAEKCLQSNNTSLTHDTKRGTELNAWRKLTLKATTALMTNL